MHGGDKVGGNEIVAIAGLRQGMNIWNVDAVAIEKKIAKHPWVRRVLVRREFPAPGRYRRRGAQPQSDRRRR